jgi:RNA polymerase subunit RPABC4/transcription elongation factor Spt4
LPIALKLDNAKISHMETINSIINFFNSPLFRFLLYVTRIFLIVLWLSLAYWTYRDAKSRGAMAFYWFLVTLIFPLFGWLIYLVVRPPELLAEVRERELDIKAKEIAVANGRLLCPACGRPVEKDFLICPYCLKKLKKACPQCQHALKLNWTICPYCQTTQTM